MRVDARVPLDLNVEAEGVISRVRVAGLCCLSIRCNPVSGEEEIMEEKVMNLEQQLVLHLTYYIFIVSLIGLRSIKARLVINLHILIVPVILNTHKQKPHLLRE